MSEIIINNLFYPPFGEGIMESFLPLFLGRAHGDGNMLKNRIGELKTRGFMRGRCDIRKRHKILLGIEGWYEFDFQIKDLLSTRLYELFCACKPRVKLTKWLDRIGINPEIVSVIGGLIEPVKFRVSCRHNDLLRLSESKHYDSCFKNIIGIQQLRYLADPDIGIVYIPDKSGKYKWRSLLRLVTNSEGKYCLFLHKQYGNTNFRAVCERLNNILPLYVGIPKKEYLITDRTNIHILKSATIQNNEIALFSMWTDHNYITKNNQLIFKGTKYKPFNPN